MRRGYTYLIVVGLTTLCTAGALHAQGPARTIRVATVGAVGTPRALTVSVDRAWRLVDLADHRLVCEGTGQAEWDFRLTRSGRVSVQRDGGSSSAESAGGGSRSSSQSWSGESNGFRLEGIAPDQRFSILLGKRTRVYPGAVEVLPAGQHSPVGLRLINEAPLEQYLAGVVTAEGSASFQPEALKALAVAARSYAERNRGRHQPDAEMCDTVHCQVYPGVGTVKEKVARAVLDTAGVVGLWGGTVIDGVFSADCGGRTRNNEEVWPVWGRIPYLRSVEDRPPNGGPDYCSVCRIHTSRLRLTPPQVGRLLGLRGAPSAAVTLSQIDRDGSGQVAALRLSFSDPPSRSSGAANAGAASSAGEEDEPLPCERAQPGNSAATRAFTTLESRAITLSQIRRSLGGQFRGRWVDSVLFPDGSLEVECRGLGHGVGLCQWGAQGMALPPYNHTFDEILRHYYTGITLGPAPIRTARLSLQLRSGSGHPWAGASVRLLPGGPAGMADGQGQWNITVPEGTYTIEAGGNSSRMTFFGVRVAAGRAGEARLALSCTERGDRIARAHTNGAGG